MLRTRLSGWTATAWLIGEAKLTRLSLGAYPRRQVHRRPEQVIILGHRLTGVQADPHHDRFGRTAALDAADAPLILLGCRLTF